MSPPGVKEQPIVHVPLEATVNVILIHGTNSEDTGMGVVRPINDAVKMKATARMIRIASRGLYVGLKTARKDAASMIVRIVVNSSPTFSTQVRIFILF